jgi:hypothetical protein
VSRAVGSDEGGSDERQRDEKEDGPEPAPRWARRGWVGAPPCWFSTRIGIRALEVGGRTLRQVATIDLPGPVGRRFDYLTIDDKGRYLFSAHLAAGLLYVIDLSNNTVVAAIPDVPGVEGLAYIAEGHKVYTSNWYENKTALSTSAR